MIVNIFVYRYQQYGSDKASYNKNSVYSGKMGANLAVNEAEQDTAKHQDDGKQHKTHVFSLGNTAGRRCAPYQLHKRNPAKAETGTEGKGCLIGNSLQPDQGIGEFQRIVS